jgi:peptide/nickel transport system substrate-binding protein
MRTTAMKVALTVTMALSAILATSAAVGASGVRAASYARNITVAEVTSLWPGLDPATDSQDAADGDYMDSVYGQLFEQGPHNTVLPDEATGSSLSNHNLTVTITLRKGLKFSDGTPFNSQAVVTSIQRDLNPANVCSCQSTFADVSSVNTKGNLAFQLQLKSPFAAVIPAFLGDGLNWTISPSALSSMGEVAFAQHPVGAGPFTVVSNTASASLTVTANPHYWQGAPYLHQITFISVGTSESAYEALQSGSVQFVTGPLDPSVVQEARSARQLLTAPGTSAITAQLNTKVAPFNNVLAREAAYYALDPKLLLKSVGLNNGVVTETPGGPADSFWQKTIPNYRSFDLAKAQKLVQQAGPIKVTLTTTGNPSIVWADAIANEWNAAGMTVTVSLIARTQLVSNYQTGNWTASVQLLGNADPSIGVGGMADRMVGGGEFSGVDDPTLNGLLERAAQLAAPATRAKLYSEAYALMNKDAYAPFIVSVPLTAIESSAVKATPLGGAGGFTVEWQNVK